MASPLLEWPFSRFFVDITGLPEPVQLALKVIELETTVQDRDTKIENLEETIADLRSEIERNNKEYEFQLNKNKSEIKNMKEKLEMKTESLNKRNYANGNTDRLQIEKLKEELKNVKEANEQVLGFACFGAHVWLNTILLDTGLTLHVESCSFSLNILDMLTRYFIVNFEHLNTYWSLYNKKPGY